MKLKFKFVSSLILLFFLTLSSLTLIHRPLESIPPTSIKDTLSNSQLSYFARLSSGTTRVGDSILKVVLSGNPSNTSNNLFVGDTIGIGTTGVGVGTSGGLTIYTIKDIGDTATFEINAGIGQSNAFVNAAIIATHSAIHTISFTPQSSVANGVWQVLIKASGRSGETHNDGIPDQSGFDLGATTPSSGAYGLGTRLKAADVSCPWSMAAGVGTTVVLTSSSIGLGDTGPYHLITCTLSGGNTNPIGTGATITIGRALDGGTSGSQIINPAPGISATEGTANASYNTFSFLIRHTDGSTVIDADTARGRIAVVEAVRVTATVDPTISFAIDTGGVGTTACGLTLSTNQTSVTALAVPFGSLSVGSTGNNLAQHLSAVTNATSGYVVTVYESAVMTMIGAATTIPDTNCDAGPCTTASANEWSTDTAESGLGYSLQNVDVGVSIFNYNGSSRTFNAKPFGVGTANAANIMTNTSTPTTTEDAFVCYRIVANTTQKAGNYENELVYTATATF